jgi:hypothetical protein
LRASLTRRTFLHYPYYFSAVRTILDSLHCHQSVECECKPRGLRLAVLSRAETPIVAANRAVETFLKNFDSRAATVASRGVYEADILPDLPGVKPSEARLGAVAPSAGATTVLEAAPPSRRSFARLRPGVHTSESSLTPLGRHPSSVESMAGRVAA